MDFEDRGEGDLTLQIEKLKKKVQEAELETSLVKAVGVNSPEMKALKKEIEKVKADLAREKENRQYDNLVHQKEIENLLKRIRRQ
jgi:hypothetical protein